MRRFLAITPPAIISTGRRSRSNRSGGRRASCVRHGKRLRHFASLSPRGTSGERVGERGEIDKKRLLSPALSSFLEEERERKRGCALKANLLPNTTGGTPVPLPASNEYS